MNISPGERKMLEGLAEIIGTPVDDIIEAATWVRTAIAEVMELAEIPMGEAALLVTEYVNAQSDDMIPPHPLDGAEIIQWKLEGTQ